jgi:ligand-binding SRPBCC domain-containing protein
MPLIQLETLIQAPPEICFDLARDVSAHLNSASGTQERLISISSGKTGGLLELNDEVTWEGVHFGIRQRLTAKVTRLERPRLFVDEMVRGAFRSFKHTHEFIAEGQSTRMLDHFEFVSPLGPLGAIANALVLTRHMRHFLQERAIHLKRAAEQAR